MGSAELVDAGLDWAGWGMAGFGVVFRWATGSWSLAAVAFGRIDVLVRSCRTEVSPAGKPLSGRAEEFLAQASVTGASQRNRAAPRAESARAPGRSRGAAASDTKQDLHRMGVIQWGESRSGGAAKAGNTLRKTAVESPGRVCRVETAA
ncbi:hypothetical protein [Amycolatopsis panacis]|uniref:Uncharacterized protein n=1 Tax=Amycolatopsis panacis TaxID=2340917 RepID=A0A419I0F7_9PSEU|nr:hypothetical protein [Amycolatopsis panacis]RJQ83072.1 hypothetical protein D5S19_20595 [Amycolatopsis panacis]